MAFDASTAAATTGTADSTTFESESLDGAVKAVDDETKASMVILALRGGRGPGEPVGVAQRSV